MTELRTARLLLRPFRAEDLAAEGGRAAIAFARERLRLAYLVALAMPENTASTRVMRRCDFAYEGPVHLRHRRRPLRSAAVRRRTASGQPARARLWQSRPARVICPDESGARA